MAFFALLATVFTITFSIALGQVFAGLCFVLFLTGVVRGQIRTRFPPVLWLVGLFVGLAVLSSFQGGEGLWWRCGKLLWFALIPVTASLLRDPGDALKLARAFLAGCAVLGVKDLVAYPILAWRHPALDYLTALIDKGSMTDGQMLMLGVLGSTVLLIAAIRGRGRVRWWEWGMLGAQGAGLLINFKRGSWFCAVILVAVVLIWQMRWRVWLPAMLVILCLFMLPPVQSRLGQLRREFTLESGGRLTMWFKVAPALIGEHPQGVGYGCLTNEMMRRAFARVEPGRNHLHANWAQVLVETGWLGFAVYVIWMLKSLRDAVLRAQGGFRGERVAALLLLTGLLLNGLVEYNFGDTELMIIYAVVMGWVASEQAGAERVST